MRILFCSNRPLTRELGAPKVIIELAEEMKKVGWECEVIGAPELKSEHPEADRTAEGYSQALRNYLLRRAGEFDVVDYEHQSLPYPRQEFAARTLFVARSVLLSYHEQTIPIPRGTSLRSRLSALVRGGHWRNELKQRIRRADATLSAADAINVSNEHDRLELLRRGTPAHKIDVIPFGLSSARRSLFDSVFHQDGPAPIVAFVGTFDPRKGAYEFPELVRRIAAEVPTVRFRLLGTRGLYPTKAAVLACFPSAQRERVEVIPHFAANELPQLLAPCSAGIFPSHFEGFAFGVLEMLAASLPVIAYNAPGPPMLLPAEHLVSRGDVVEMSRKVVHLLCNPAALSAARTWAKARAADFSWESVARTTSAEYGRRIALLRTISLD